MQSHKRVELETFYLLGAQWVQTTPEMSELIQKVSVFGTKLQPRNKMPVLK
jgi:hypothetical protein